MGAPGLDAILQMGPYESRVEGEKHLPHPAGLPFLLQPKVQDEGDSTEGLHVSHCEDFNPKKIRPEREMRESDHYLSYVTSEHAL